MRIRLRFSNGKNSVFDHADPTINDLLDEIRTQSGSHEFEIKLGYPPFTPILLSAPPETKLADLELPEKLHGSQLIINTPAPEEPKPTPPVSSRSEQLRPQKPQKNKDDPPSINIPNRGEIIHVVMPDDNSCLFNAINYTCAGSIYTAQELRSMIIAEIRENADLYSEAVLGQKLDAYCEWINMSTSWGGAIELEIFSKRFEVEIICVYVQTGNKIRFNEGKPERVILVYSGIHYDAIALRPGLGYRIEDDVRRFDSSDDVILEGALELGRELRKREYFTDTGSFKLQCKQCGTMLKGSKQAQEHGNTTGHSDFEECRE